MEQIDLLRLLIQAMERLGIPYMVVGSLASAAYGEPRMTQDIDVVLDLNESQVRPLCEAFPSEDYYVSEQAAVLVKSKPVKNGLVMRESLEFNNSISGSL